MASGTRGVLRSWRYGSSIIEGSSVSAACSRALQMVPHRSFQRRTYTAKRPLSMASNALQASSARQEAQGPNSVESGLEDNGGRKRSSTDISEQIQELQHKPKDTKLFLDKRGYNAQHRPLADGRANAEFPDARAELTKQTGPSSIDPDSVDMKQPTLFPLLSRGPSMARVSASEKSRKRVQTWLKDVSEESEGRAKPPTGTGQESRRKMDVQKREEARETTRDSPDISEFINDPRFDQYNYRNDRRARRGPFRNADSFEQQHLEEEVKGTPAMRKGRRLDQTADREHSSKYPRSKYYEPLPAQLLESDETLSVYDYTCAHPASRLVYARDATHANAELETMLTMARKPWGARVAGLDCEWRPSFDSGASDSPVALVQIALGSTILLLQVSAMGEFPDALRQFLADPAILKAGVGVLDDCKRLYRDYKVSTYGCVELSYLSRCIDAEHWQPGIGGKRSLISLARLVEAYERRAIPKKKSVRTSNWEAVLSSEQQAYAGNDAHAGMALALGLLSRVPPELDHQKFTFNVVNGAAMHLDGSAWEARSLKKKIVSALKHEDSDENASDSKSSVESNQYPSEDDSLSEILPRKAPRPRNIGRGKAGLERVVEGRRQELLKHLGITARNSS